MRKSQRFNDALDQAQALAKRQETSITIQRLAFHMFHTVEGASVRKRAGVMHGNDTGMLHARQDDGLLHQPRSQASRAVFSRENLEGHGPLQDRILRQPDRSHAAVPKKPERAVAGAGEVGSLQTQMQTP